MAVFGLLLLFMMIECLLRVSIDCGVGILAHIMMEIKSFCLFILYMFAKTDRAKFDVTSHQY